ncbi:MAG: hypothetical protein E7256_12130 [Lachnospiraceae bacterium]|nr:hypothetical protein [Lachnospiraceae bacterium]
MSTKTERLQASIAKSCDPELTAKTSEILLSVPKATPKKQAKQIGECLNLLISNHEDIAPIMRRCNCLSDSVLKKASALYEEAGGDLDLFLSLLNEQGIGGGHLTREEDGIHAVYTRCYCGIAKNAKDMPESYCECSAGWFQHLFSSVLNRDVNVTILHTILSGQQDCTFLIS